MSAKDQLILELSRQPERVAAELLEYLHVLVSGEANQAASEDPRSHWDRYIGAWSGLEFDRPEQGRQPERDTW